MLRDIIGLYKGPILDMDIVFRLFIEEWQKHTHVPFGLFADLMYLMKRTRRRERQQRILRFLGVTVASASALTLDWAR